jgi:hypothetical protein
MFQLFLLNNFIKNNHDRLIKIITNLPFTDSQTIETLFRHD